MSEDVTGDVPSPTYAKCFVSLALGLAPLFLALGIAAMFGLNTMTVNRQFVHGPMALLISAVTPIVVGAVLAAFQKLGYAILGYWSDQSVSIGD